MSCVQVPSCSSQHSRALLFVIRSHGPQFCILCIRKILFMALLPTAGHTSLSTPSIHSCTMHYYDYTLPRVHRVRKSTSEWLLCMPQSVPTSSHATCLGDHCSEVARNSHTESSYNKLSLRPTEPSLSA